MDRFQPLLHPERSSVSLSPRSSSADPLAPPLCSGSFSGSPTLATLPNYQSPMRDSVTPPERLQEAGSIHMDFPYRFQRTDQWRPVYSWLESLENNTIVNSKEITDWLSSNTDFRDRLLARHSRYHLMHYIQKLHLKLLKKKGKLPKV
ncbi:hypothetical protein KSP40_PGU002623 [Platanthera guangdongensis]|uniref:Uncharacterized protein n=1 Tax=Platanthera guangdongensis TaxID=2320717 RepID=A0ABR2LXB1_9ASPA